MQWRACSGACICLYCQAAHEAEAASLRGAVATAQQERDATGAAAAAAAEAHEAALSALRTEQERLSTLAAALEANLGAHFGGSRAPACVPCTCAEQCCMPHARAMSCWGAANSKVQQNGAANIREQ
jgi:hypothetical protein